MCQIYPPAYPQTSTGSSVVWRLSSSLESTFVIHLVCVYLSSYISPDCISAIMSYVPPHLRSSTKTLEINGNNSHYTNSHSNNNNNNFYSSSRHNLSPPPDSVVPQWKPSQRVLALKPHQVPSFSSFLLKLIFATYIIHFAFSFNFIFEIVCFPSIWEENLT